VIVSVDTSSAVPAYEQIRAQITALADSGALPARTHLPSVRQLAEDLVSHLAPSPGLPTARRGRHHHRAPTSRHRHQRPHTSSEEVRLASLLAAAVVYDDIARLLNAPATGHCAAEETAK